VTKRTKGYNLYNDHAATKWDQLQKSIEDLEKAKKPPLVKVAQKHLLQILKILAWGYGSIN
jgi:2-keto-3-deoxy-L-rhamnonate aldolase RhmA